MERLESGRGRIGKLIALRPAVAFKHALVVRGIGGRTVRELDRNLHQAELQDWARYFHYFPQDWDLSGRVERLIARVASGLFGGEVEPSDLLELPDGDRREVETQNFLDAVQMANSRLAPEGVDDG